jgi:hypothetical protein
MKVKRFTEDQFNSLSEEQRTQIVRATNDGQGDTKVLTFPMLYDSMEPELWDLPLFDMLKTMDKDCNTNPMMTQYFWVEDSELFMLKFWN